mgnify:CR=1 FL=1
MRAARRGHEMMRTCQRTIRYTCVMLRTAYRYPPRPTRQPAAPAVVIRDRYLGLTYLAAQVAILLYVVVY